MKYTQEEENIIKDGVSSGKSYQTISSDIFDSLGITRDAESVRSRYKLMRKKDPSLKPLKTNSQNSVMAVVEDEEPTFSVDTENMVTWKYKHGVIELPLDSLDDIFYRYSRHGLNMSQVKIQNHYGLTAIQWQSLKRTFDLVKDSDVFSPYSLSLVSGKEATQMIADKIADKYSPKNMREVIEYEDGKQRKKAYDNAIKKVSELDYRRSIFESEILDYLSESKLKVTVTKTADAKIEHGVSVVQDLHVGANIPETRNLPRFDEAVIRDRLNQVAIDINERGAKKNTIVFNGDLIETFTGLNHINSWKNIDAAYGYGVRATIKAYELINEFLQKVNNIHEVLIVAGNHDRTTSNNNEDVDGEVVQWIHYMVKGTFGKQFNVEWSSDVITRLIGGVGYIFTHGHLGISKRSAAEIVNLYGFPGVYNIVCEGHLHTRKIKADTATHRVCVFSSIFTGNNYSEKLGFSTLPGYAYLYSKKGLNYPVVIDVPLA
jgi:metallophosphoesterase superfamily enzyme